MRNPPKGVCISRVPSGPICDLLRVTKKTIIIPFVPAEYLIFVEDKCNYLDGPLLDYFQPERRVALCLIILAR